MTLSVWKIGYTVLLIGAATYGLTEMRGSHGLGQLMAKRLEVKALERQNEVLHKEIESRRNRIGRLRDSPEEQELEIRKRLKLVKPGEKTYIVEDGKPASR